MKKIFIPVLAFIVMSAMSSCIRSNYNCKCTTVGVAGVTTSNQLVYGNWFGGGKAHAKTECESMSSKNASSETVCKMED